MKSMAIEYRKLPVVSWVATAWVPVVERHPKGLCVRKPKSGSTGKPECEGTRIREADDPPADRVQVLERIKRGPATVHRLNGGGTMNWSRARKTVLHGA